MYLSQSRLFLNSRYVRWYRRLYFRKRFEEAKGIKRGGDGCDLKSQESDADKEAAAREAHPIHN